VSAQISEQTSQFYVGTLNGVMYRIRPGAMTPGGKLFALEPFEAPSSRTLLTPLFKREGAEPLRAGHPDLWALLVRGTSLEGTSFQAASAS
jgi:hypothetical protein